MDENLSRADIIATYKDDVLSLTPFLPWLKSKAGESISHNYKNDEKDSDVISFPVYDSQVFSLIKAINKTKFVNRNYVYTYSTYRMNSVQDELRVIPTVGTMNIKVLGDILSKYAIKGQSKAGIWNEGVSEGVFYAVIKRLAEVVDLHDNQIV